jgi:hypothetical protein
MKHTPHQHPDQCLGKPHLQFSDEKVMLIHGLLEEQTHCILDWCVRVDPVLVVQINIWHLEPLQRIIERLLHVLRLSIDASSSDAKLGGELNLQGSQAIASFSILVFACKTKSD